MRISDWSSDVCSSDLYGDFPRSHKPEAGEATLIPLPVMSEKIRRRPRIGSDAPPLLSGGRTQGHGRVPSSSLLYRSEIGRASCRERVVSVRVDLGGRRIIKKKTKREIQIIKYI